MGRIRREGYPRPCLTVCFAEMTFTSDEVSFLVFEFGSKRRKIATLGWIEAVARYSLFGRDLIHACAGWV